MFDVVVVVQLFAVRDENTLESDSLERLLLLGRMVVAGGTVGGSGINGRVMAGTMGACVGSERRTVTGSGSGLPGGEDAAIAGGRGVRKCFVVFWGGQWSVSIWVTEEERDDNEGIYGVWNRIIRMGGWEAGTVRRDGVGVCLDDVSIWRTVRWIKCHGYVTV